MRAIPFLVAAAIAMWCGANSSTPRSAFRWAVFCFLFAGFCMIQWRELFHSNQNSQFFSESLRAIGRRLQNSASWIRRMTTTHPLATTSVVLWMLVLVCCLLLSNTDKPFICFAVLAITLHAAIACTLAWGGKLGAVYEKALGNIAISWAYVSVWLMILAAAYGYEAGYLHWLWYPQFIWALTSFVLAVAVAIGALQMAGKALGKALVGGFGNAVAFLAWGSILVPLSVGWILGTGYELKNTLTDPLFIMLGIGMGLICIVAPLAYLLKFKG